jgi:hypothetical protein
VEKTSFGDALLLGSERPRLFDVREDPDEKFDRLEKERDEGELLYDKLRQWSEGLPIPPDAVPLSPREMENLRHLFNSLGYPGDSEDEPKR